MRIASFVVLLLVGFGCPASARSGSGVAIRGTVTTAEGVAIPNATVIAVRELVDPRAGIERRLAALVRLQDGRTLPISRTVGDDAGRFVLEAGNELNYRLFVVAAGYTPRVLRSVPNPSRGLTVTLERGLATQGVVVAKGGEPLVGAEVELRFAPPDSRKDPDILESVMSRLLPPIWRGASGENGVFECPYGSPGLALVAVARKRGFQEGEGAGTSDRPIRVSLEPGLRLTGTVLDPTEKPLAGAEISLTIKIPGRSTPMGAPVCSAVTAADGTFEIDGLPGGEHRILVCHPRYSAYRHPRFRVTAEPARFRLIEGRELEITVRDAETGAAIRGASVRVEEERDVVREGSADENGVFVARGLRPAGQPDVAVTASAPGYAPNTPERWKFSKLEAAREIRLYRALTATGSVVSEVGQPVPGAVVFLQESVGTLKTPASEASVVRTGPEGKFRFEGVAPKKLYFYRVAHPDYLDHEGEAFLVVPGVELEPTKVELLSPLAVTGVVRGASGQPLAGARVGVLGVSNLIERVDQLDRRAVCDAEGRFRVEGLPAGEHRLLVQADGYRDRRGVSVTLVRGKPSPIDIELEAAAELTGVVVDADGKPVSGAAIAVIDTTDGLVRFSTTSDAEGRFRVSELGGFPVTVKAEKAGVGEARLEEVPLDRPVTVELR